jgi:hypothetical protein
LIEFPNIAALPLLVKVWGPIWVFTSGLFYWAITRVPHPGEELRRTAERAVEANLWNINRYLDAKVRLHVGDSDYLGSAREVEELRNVVLDCASPLNHYSRCSSHLHSAKLYIGLHALLVLPWAATVLYTNWNTLIVGLILFVIPLARAGQYTANAVRAHRRLVRPVEDGS